MRDQKVADLDDYFELKELDRGLVESLERSFVHLDEKTYPLEDSVLRPLRLESELAGAFLAANSVVPNLHSQAQEPQAEFLQEPVPIVHQQENTETSSFEPIVHPSEPM